MDSPITTLPTLPTFPTIKLSLFINLPILLLIFGLFAIFYAIVTSVLVYHWSHYGMRSQGILVGESLFFIVTIFLFVSALISLSYF